MHEADYALHAPFMEAAYLSKYCSHDVHLGSTEVDSSTGADCLSRPFTAGHSEPNATTSQCPSRFTRMPCAAGYALKERVEERPDCGQGFVKRPRDR